MSLSWHIKPQLPLFFSPYSIGSVSYTHLVEAHVCVLQSVIDLKADRYNVLLVEDCIASRKMSDKETAVKRAMGEGAYITSAEAVLFELTFAAGTPHFKTISKIVK